MIDMTGKEIGRYQFRERLGAGGMAMVYKAYDTRLEREVAIKVIQTDVFAPNVLAEVLARFEREAKALARLNHPHIVKVYDYGDFDGLPYLVMEYHSGGTVKRFTSQPHPYYDCARLIAPVARALEYAHQRGILHRDVKPSNILLNESHQPLLTDFGIAKILEMSSNTGLTASGVGIGTPEYIAPEQGVGSGADPRSDVYSLGIVFYELITGRRPYSADTPMGVILAHVTRPLPDPREFVPDLPEQVVTVLYQALAKEPNDRFADMGTFAEALEQLAAERPTAQSIRAIAPAPGSQPTEAHIPTPHPSTMAPVHTPPGTQTPVPSQPGSQPISRPGSQPISQPGISRPVSQPASQPASPPISQPASQPIYPPPAPRTPAPFPTQASAQPQSMDFSAEVQPTLQTPVPTQLTPQPMPAGAAVPVSQPARQQPPQFRPKPAAPAKNNTTQWIILGALGLLAIAVIAVGIGMLLRDNAVTSNPTQPVQVGGPPLTSATQLALAPDSGSTAPVLAPTETITPLPSPTPLPQFISDQFDHALALIPAGDFLMGSLAEDTTAKDDERTQFSLKMASFYIDVHETTNADYSKCVAEGKCLPPTNMGSSTAASYYDNPEFANYPVLFVSWQAASDYCKWRGGRLPTEAEWEYAARGGLANQPFPWGDQSPSCESQTTNGANSNQCPYSGTVPVGGYANNGYGLYDMAGNVAEWTSSLYRPYPYNAADGREDPLPVEQRVLRGGSWDGEILSMRNAARRALNQNAVDNSIGFRCVVDLGIVTQGSGSSPASQPEGGSSSSGSSDQPGLPTPTPTIVFRIVTPVVRITLAPTLYIQPTLILLPSKTPTATPSPTMGLIILPTRILLPTATKTDPPLIILPTRVIIIPTNTPVPTATNTPIPPSSTPVPRPTNTPIPIRKYPPEILAPSDGGTYKIGEIIDFCFYSGMNIGTYAFDAAIDGRSGGKMEIGEDVKKCDSGKFDAGTHTFEVTVFANDGVWNLGVKFEVR